MVSTASVLYTVYVDDTENLSSFYGCSPKVCASVVFLSFIHYVCYEMLSQSNWCVYGD